MPDAPRVLVPRPGFEAKQNIQQLARAHAHSALAALLRVMSDPRATGSARVAAAIAILDRGWGKPEVTASVKVTGNVRDISTAELIEIIRAGDGGGERDAETPERVAEPDIIH